MSYNLVWIEIERETKRDDFVLVNTERAMKISAMLRKLGVVTADGSDYIHYNSHRHVYEQQGGHIYTSWDDNGVWLNLDALAKP